jgi:transcription initiation factor IIE alpha subunit
MTDHNFESTVVVEISPQTDELVETEMAGETDEVKRETKALIEALKRRAQTEAESAGTLTRETYLNAVRQAREALEGEKLIERDRLERSFAVIQQEADRNWNLLLKEISDFGDRLQNAAKAAWEAFNAPRSQS